MDTNSTLLRLEPFDNATRFAKRQIKDCFVAYNEVKGSQFEVEGHVGPDRAGTM